MFISQYLNKSKCKIAMEPHFKISSSTQVFIVKLKYFLDSIGISFSEFFNNFETINKNQISKLEFFRIITLLNIDGQQNVDPHQVFLELSKKESTIDTAYLKKIYSAIGNLAN